MFSYQLGEELKQHFKQSLEFSSPHQHQLIIKFKRCPLMLKVYCYNHQYNDFYEVFFNVDYDGDYDDYDFFSTWFNNYFWYWKFGLKELIDFINKIKNELKQLNIE